MNNKTTLLIDADDTLWENNKYFEEVIDKIVEIIKKYVTLEEDEIKDCIWKHEKESAKKYGYGSSSFARAIKEVVKELLIDYPDEHNNIFEIIDKESKNIYNHPINFFDGVEEHLKELKEKYELILVTKGNEEEQSNKVNRSGIKIYFKNIVILPEKHSEAYEEIVKKFKLDKKNTYMIGNSPKSDINPSKKIGLNTILIPYHLTWQLEKEEIFEGEPETGILKNFKEIDTYIISRNGKKS